MPKHDRSDAGEAVVRDIKRLRSTLRRLQASNDAVMLRNAEGTLKLLLCNDPDMDDEHDSVKTVYADLCIVVDEDEAIEKALELEPSGYKSWHGETSVFVLDSFEVTMEGSDKEVDEELQEVARCINTACRYRICPCGDYLIKDGADVCLYCDMTAGPGELEATEFCAICQDKGCRAHMVLQTCCNQTLHRGCLATWKTRGEGDTDRCPMCRQGE